MRGNVAIGPQVRSSDSLGWSALPTPVPDASSDGGWLSWADWRNTPPDPISSFVATWQVPPEPNPAGDQLIYLFNGLQDANEQHILQPVLQWGTSPAQGSGNFWGLSSFWVGQAADPMFCTECVRVAAGAPVTGIITVTAQANGLFSCSCEFDGYPATKLTAENLPTLVDAVLTLEAYGISLAAPYPGISETAFTGVALTAATIENSPAWAPFGGATVKPDGSVEVAYPASAA